MKPVIAILAAGFWVGATGVGWSQNRVGTPAALHPLKGAPSTAAVTSRVQNSNMHAVNAKLRLQMRQIHKDVKSGKLAAGQAKAQFEKLKSVRRQELEFFRQNGQKEITADQRNQLEQNLK